MWADCKKKAKLKDGAPPTPKTPRKRKADGGDGGEDPETPTSKTAKRARKTNKGTAASTDVANDEEGAIKSEPESE